MGYASTIACNCREHGQNELNISSINKQDQVKIKTGKINLRNEKQN